jgi:hypothetical protein
MGKPLLKWPLVRRRRIREDRDLTEDGGWSWLRIMSSSGLEASDSSVRELDPVHVT